MYTERARAGDLASRDSRLYLYRREGCCGAQLSRLLVFSDPVPILEMASRPTPLTRLCSNTHNQERGTHLALVTPGQVSEFCSSGSAFKTGFFQIRASVLLLSMLYCLPTSSLFLPAMNWVSPHHCPCIPQSVQPTSRTHRSSLCQPQSTQKESTGKSADSAFLPGTCNHHLSLIAKPINGFPSSFMIKFRSSRSSEYL